MQQIAVVKRLLPGNQAELQVKRKTACGHDCANCGGCGEIVSKPIMVIADNSIGAQVGESVVITGSSRQVLGLAAILYLVPIVLFFVVYGVAALLSLPIPELWGGAGFFGGIFGAKKVNDRQKDRAPVYTISKL